MLKAFRRLLKTEFKVSGNEKFLLAVSGGLDSVVMTSMFHESGLPFGIAHCNFQLRGTESKEDEDFVRHLAKSLKVKFHSKAFRTAEIAKENSSSIQEAARILRYVWFEEIRNSGHYDLVATAHHLNDSIETLIFNLSRGTGLRGLRGIPYQTGKVIRPLSIFSREELENYALDNQLNWREDKSNSKTEYSRNLIRHKVIPVLKELNPALERTMKNNIRIFKETNELFEWASEKILKSLSRQNKKGAEIDLDRLLEYPGAPGILNEFLKPFDFNKDQARSILANYQSKNHSTGARFFSARYLALIDRSKLIIREEHKATGVDFQIEIEEDCPTVELPEGILNIRVSPLNGGVDINPHPHFAYLDSENIRFPLTLRRWQDGDSFCPFGMDGKHKKLSDYFTDLKLSLFQKSRVWVLLSGDDILWIVGYRPDERYKVTDTTNNIIHLNWEEN